MGQPITVTVRPGVRGDVMNFELNRSLTGMETHRYTAAQPPTGPKPPDELARRLFALPGVSAVTVYSSVVTVVAPQDQWGRLQPEVEDTITNLFIYYRDGQPPAAVTSGDGAPAEEAAVSG
ncbi:MAG TPA: NifU N-terminal domain-containing protein [Acidimicrobiia bacterium]|nr:NifU N-terminal domain-containing protein [Acidimicrobiia bacterium]